MDSSKRARISKSISYWKCLAVFDSQLYLQTLSKFVFEIIITSLCWLELIIKWLIEIYILKWRGVSWPLLVFIIKIN